MAALVCHLSVQWEERVEEGLFRYDVSACETKVRAGASAAYALLTPCWPLLLVALPECMRHGDVMCGT